MSNLLFEIGTEELPAGYIDPALDQMKEKFFTKAKELKINHGDVKIFATPRRLALIVEKLSEKQDDITEELIGPSVKAGLDGEGNPTKAAQGFARSKGVDPQDLKVVETPKGQYLTLKREVKGKAVNALLPGILTNIVTELSFPKSMRWGSNTQQFARPVQWLLAINGNDLVEMEFEGLHSSKITRGHRFHNNVELEIQNADSYEQQLLEVNVIVDQEKRKISIEESVKKSVQDDSGLEGAEVFIDQNLLHTVNYLVEKPVAICGHFDEKFLQLPDEVLITSMREHQKYFPVIDKEGKLLAGFVAVNNTKAVNADLTRQGHQRVLRARLEDALFFFKSDQDGNLEDLIPRLDGIIFQAKLGTMREKNDRIIKLTRLLAEMVAPTLVADGCRAAELAKVDLLTDMVGEFPSLQGVMGQAYAEISGEKKEVALAIREHYMPKRAGAALPNEPIGALVGLADRIDTLSGCFGIGQVPSGTADPFGLRRISLAILHIISEFDYSISLREVIHKALALYGDRVDGSMQTVDNVLQFIEGRYKNDRLTKGVDADTVAAALSAGFDDVNVVSMRVEALTRIKSDEKFTVLASSYKRIRNIIKDNKTNDIDEYKLVEDAEKVVYDLLCQVREEMEPLVADLKFYEALQKLLKIKEPLDTFFDKVMVMAEDDAVRQNRLNLLTSLGELVLQIGDISLMQTSD